MAADALILRQATASVKRTSDSREDSMSSASTSVSDPSTVQEQLAALDASRADYATDFVDVLLAAAASVHASVVHLQPTASGLDVRWRLDGVLQLVGVFPPGEAADVVSRLKVLAELLAYRTDVPQEGRIRERRDNV